jgi:hypothetical protein
MTQVAIIVGLSLTPAQAKVWREAWDLLLTDRYTLQEICEILHARGYTFRSGRLFVDKTKSKKSMQYAVNALSKAFHNPVYAGWMINDNVGLPKGTQIEGKWEAIITPEEFDKGVTILKRRMKHRIPKHRHHYLLTGILYMRHKRNHTRMTGSTPNSGRNAGGISYYIGTDGVHVPCALLDEQVPDILTTIQVYPEYLPALRKIYEAEIQQALDNPINKIDELNQMLKRIDEEEKRAVMLFAKVQITEQAITHLVNALQERRRQLNAELLLLESTNVNLASNLDEAINVLAQLPDLYGKLSKDEQSEVLRGIIARIVVDSEGKIIEVRLHPPFTYLYHRYKTVKKRWTSVNANGTVNFNSPVLSRDLSRYIYCSSYISGGGPNETRTHDLFNAIEALSQLSYRPLRC